MKSFTRFFAVAALALSLTFTAYATTGPDKGAKALDAAKEAVSAAQWDVFSKNITAALGSDHEGIQTSALQMVIRYGENVSVREAVYDVMRIYRNHSDDNMRRMAVVALGEMDSKWAIGFLKMSVEHEKSPAIRKTIQSVIAAS